MAVKTLPILKPIKMYKVSFNEYYHMLCEEKGYTRIQYKPEEQDVSEDPKLLVIPEVFIIREDEFDKYKDFGRGFYKLEYIGTMLEETREVVAE